MRLHPEPDSDNTDDIDRRHGESPRTSPAVVVDNATGGDLDGVLKTLNGHPVTSSATVTSAGGPRSPTCARSSATRPRARPAWRHVAAEVGSAPAVGDVVEILPSPSPSGGHVTLSLHSRVRSAANSSGDRGSVFRTDSNGSNWPRQNVRCGDFRKRTCRCTRNSSEQSGASP